MGVVLEVALFAAAWLGHAFLWTVALNWWYAQPLRRALLKAARAGLTVLHLTDLHLCGTPGRQFYQQVFDLCLGAGVPDLIAVTGDVVDSPHHHRWVVPLLGRLRYHVAAFAVLGNHDSYFEPELV